MDGREHFRESVESVAIDTAEGKRDSSKGGFDPYSQLVRAGLQSFHFFGYAYSASEPMAEHILAACVYEGVDAIMGLIVSALKALYCAPSSWAVNETWSANETWCATLMVCYSDRFMSYLFYIHHLTHHFPRWYDRYSKPWLQSLTHFKKTAYL